jgi:tetratricopeptide (TPR) repeat protein
LVDRDIKKKGSIMKQLIFVAAGFGVIITLGVALTYANHTPDVAPSPTAASATSEAAASATLPPLQTRTTPALAALNVRAANQLGRTSISTLAKVETEPQRTLREAFETLLSPQSTFEQKQAAWKQLKDSGQLDAAVAELERQVAANPDSTADAIALAEGYFRKCGQTDDVRQQGILAMKADQLLDTALGLDPSNWQAQFDKTSAMAHWPLELNRGPKVAQQFQALIQEQESQPVQPQFALSYVRLGDFYQKTGDATDAGQVWQRGAALFPDNSDLRGRLNPAP